MASNSPESLAEGAHNKINRQIANGGINKLALENQEIRGAVGESIESLNEQGFFAVGIIDTPYAHLFFSTDPEVQRLSDEFIRDYGGEENVRVYKILRTNEVIVFRREEAST
jgi:hypothetical protein